MTFDKKVECIHDIFACYSAHSLNHIFYDSKEKQKEIDKLDDNLSKNKGLIKEQFLLLNRLWKKVDLLKYTTEKYTCITNVKIKRKQAKISYKKLKKNINKKK